MPSQHSVTKARQQIRALLGISRGERMQFSIHTIGYNEVTFLYGGYEIHFSINDGRLTRDGRDHIYLQEDDYRLLFFLAYNILKARERHIRNKNTHRKKKTPVVSPTQKEFSF